MEIRRFGDAGLIGKIKQQPAACCGVGHFSKHQRLGTAYGFAVQPANMSRLLHRSAFLHLASLLAVAAADKSHGAACDEFMNERRASER